MPGDIARTHTHLREMHIGTNVRASWRSYQDGPLLQFGNRFRGCGFLCSMAV